jgi:hypothetical protein
MLARVPRSVRSILLLFGVLALLYVTFRIQYEQSHFLAPNDVHDAASASAIWAERANSVRKAFLHAYGEYERSAFPHDELLPLSRGWVDK